MSPAEHRIRFGKQFRGHRVYKDKYTFFDSAKQTDVTYFPWALIIFEDRGFSKDNDEEGKPVDLGSHYYYI